MKFYTTIADEQPKYHLSPFEMMSAMLAVKPKEPPVNVIIMYHEVYEAVINAIPAMKNPSSFCGIRVRVVHTAAEAAAAAIEEMDRGCRPAIVRVESGKDGGK